MLILDAGALIAIDRADHRVGALLRLAQQHALPVRTSAAAVAQVWRNGSRQAGLARTIQGIDTVPLDQLGATKVGALLAIAGGHDVVDAHVVQLAHDGDQILTSDPRDIGRLLGARRADVVVTRV